MIVTGYKLRGYDATYEKTIFDIRKHAEDEDGCSITIEDVDAGISFVFRLDRQNDICKYFSPNYRKKPRTNDFDKQDLAQKKHQITITHGKASRLHKK